MTNWNHKQSIKEVLKHSLFIIGAQNVINFYRKKRGFITNHLEGIEVSDRFRKIYKMGVWLHEDNQISKSGLGSESISTVNLINLLPKVLHKLNCQLILDIGCGDWNWMSKVNLPCKYIGIDIVPEVIKENKEQFENNKEVAFLLANAIEDKLPKADVVLCREVLFHLSFEDGLSTIANIKKDSKWLIATTTPSLWFNSNIITGDFRNINLQRPPYNLPEPYEINDDGLTKGRILGIWRFSE